MFATILSVAANIGYPTLFLLVAAESGGIPLPGETALVTGALLASQHKLQIPLVIAVAAGAAILGDNLGYLIGRKGGRWLLERPGPLARSRRQVLSVGVPFFERHGPRAVFFGRWLIGLRTWASWLAGATRMPWRSFAIWNAAGGLGWATSVGLAAYFAGQSAKSFLAAFAVYGLVSTALAVIGALLWQGRRDRPSADGPGDSSAGADRGGHQPRTAVR
jgi:membrane protein DedA with SNARE-associated domain